MTPLLLGLLALAAETPPPPEQAYVLILANNASTDPGVARLRFADDDGARYFELFSLMAERAEILTVMDEPTQRLFPDIAARARAPTEAELGRTLDSMFEQIRRAEARGERTSFYFVYVGHGSVGSDGEGTMHLSDGRFTRSDLFQKLIARSPARINHLIIDACNAYLMVARRGDDEEAAIDRAVGGFLAKENLDRYPNTGVLVSTSEAADVHEWSRFQAGVFSHEVRSALAGGADVDGDGKVSYAEARAFIGAANARVSVEKARLEVFAAPPGVHQGEPLFDRARARTAVSLRVPASVSGRRWLEDERGVRYADFNVAADGAVTLALVPRAAYYLRSESEEMHVPSGAMARVDAGDLVRRPVEMASRGVEEESFRRDLFALPFGRAYYEGYRASAAQLPSLVTRAPERGLAPLKIAALSLGAGAVAAGVVGAVFGVEARDRAQQYRDQIAPAADLERLRQDSKSAELTANILYAVGGALAGGALSLWLVAD